MEIQKIVNAINDKLNGETLSYTDLLIHLDATIDDINQRLSAKFPVFSEFTTESFPEHYPNYDFFPDKYIRTVVIKGVAAKFYCTDEEGIDSAKQYTKEYNDALFLMLRDYSNSIPAEYQDYEQGFVVATDQAQQFLDFDRESSSGGCELIW
jgi:hypothetical protein